VNVDAKPNTFFGALNQYVSLQSTSLLHRKPITAIAIFTGSDRKNMPHQYEYSFLGTHLTYRYHTLRIIDYSDEVLSTSNNPFAPCRIGSPKSPAGA
jgi:hypothetical protein